MVSFCSNLLAIYLNHITYSSVKNPRRKSSWMISDDVSKLAIKRILYLVVRSGQSNSSALMMFCSSVLGESS